MCAGVLYCCSRTYRAKSADELSVDMGTVVEVLQKSDNGWWLIRYVLTERKETPSTKTQACLDTYLYSSSRP